MPVIRRKLAVSPTLRPPVAASISIQRPQPQLRAPNHPTQLDQRGMNVKVAAKYLGVSVWQIRKFLRDGDVPKFRIGNRDMVDRADLDVLIERLKAAA